jgi:hypothetical protein
LFVSTRFKDTAPNTRNRKLELIAYPTKGPDVVTIREKPPAGKIPNADSRRVGDLAQNAVVINTGDVDHNFHDL